MSARGLNLVGHLQSELGLGEVARQLVGACDAAGVPVLPIDLPATASRQGHRFGHVASPVAAFASTLVCLNAAGEPLADARLGARFFAGRRRVGQWWWETPGLPPHLAESFDRVDEVWAGSRWLTEVLEAASRERGRVRGDGRAPAVHHLPVPVGEPRPAALGRAALALPEDLFLFAFAFDHHSVLDRKNPVGLIDAYRRAFGPRDGCALVVKTVNGAAHPERHAAVLAAAADREDVLVRDGYLAADEKDALIAAADAYVSLHRSEGFGLSLAEAMLLGRPVVATGWSGSADVVTEATAWVVPHRLVPIGPGRDPYPPDAVWAEPDLDAAAALLRRVVAEPEERERRARAARALVLTHHAPAAVGARIAELLAAHPAGPHGRAPALAAVEVLRAERARPAAPRPAPARIATMSAPADGPALAALQARVLRGEALLGQSEAQLADAERRAARIEVVGLERDEVRAEADELAVRIELLEADGAELRERVERASRVHDEMLGSVSWRVTRPLRAAADRLRRS